MPFTFNKTRLAGVLLIESRVLADPRGSFTELYKSSEFQEHGLPASFTQAAHSRSVKNVLRGLHYQKSPHAQARLVRAVRGEVFDVAVDLRRSSPTYGQWIGETLSASNSRMLFIPPGFAHGFCVLSGEAELVYFFAGAEYAPEFERAVAWNDPAIGIAWPVKTPLISPKDAEAPVLAAADHNF